jgi:hypothetical protein
MDRRAFLQSAAAAALTATIPAAGATAPPPATKEKMIGIQVGAASFVDEGTEKVLDEFQQDRYRKTRGDNIRDPESREQLEGS